MELAEARIKEMIIDKYGSLKKFCEIIDMPWTTLDSILKRGISNSNITNVIKITKELKIDTESLASGIITDALKKPDSRQSDLLNSDSGQSDSFHVASSITAPGKISQEQNNFKKTESQKKYSENLQQPQTIAAHFSGDEYTEEELNKIKEFAAFVKACRK